MPLETKSENQKISEKEDGEWIVVSHSSAENDPPKYDFDVPADTTPQPSLSDQACPIKLTEVHQHFFSSSNAKGAGLGKWQTSAIDKIHAAGLADVLKNPYGTGRFYQNYKYLQGYQGMSSSMSADSLRLSSPLKKFT